MFMSQLTRYRKERILLMYLEQHPLFTVEPGKHLSAYPGSVEVIYGERP